MCNEQKSAVNGYVLDVNSSHVDEAN